MSLKVNLPFISLSSWIVLLVPKLLINLSLLLLVFLMMLIVRKRERDIDRWIWWEIGHLKNLLILKKSPILHKNCWLIFIYIFYYPLIEVHFLLRPLVGVRFLVFVLRLFYVPLILIIVYFFFSILAVAKDKVEAMM